MGFDVMGLSSASYDHGRNVARVLYNTTTAEVMTSHEGRSLVLWALWSLADQSLASW